jgi:NitT/TauT family transport system substrate-binding protein
VSTQSRRRFLANAAFAGAAGLSAFSASGKSRAAEPLPEPATLRLEKLPVICFAPQYVCEEMLRAEGFTDIRYVETTPQAISEDLGRGRVDFAANLVPGHIAAIDAGAAITIVGGVHAGCYELFAREGIRSIGDLKGKSVGHYGGDPLISVLVAYVGLDAKKDLALVNDPALKPLELFAEGKLDAYLGVPPEPQILHARKVGHVILRTAVDRPWSEYFCCMLPGNRDYVRRHPAATKRVIRAFLKAADLCASAPEQTARTLVAGGFTDRYEHALQTLNENPYGGWRDYGAEDSVRFYALRLHDLGFVKSSPQKVLTEGTDFRFFDELKRELKA